VHSHAYPVFAVMFGYGIVQLARRLVAKGASEAEVRRVLVRRHGWLFAFGAAHGTLLYYGDFLGAYGIAGLLATLLLVPRGDRVLGLVRWFWGFMLVESVVLMAIVGWRLAAGQAGAAAPEPAAPIASLVAGDYLASVGERLHEWPRHTLTVVPFVFIIWLGMWAARRGLLDAPSTHYRALAWIAAAGLGIAVAGGVPMGLMRAGWLRADGPTGSLVLYLHQVSGMFGGPGYAALGGLLSIPASRALARGTGASALGALAALGQRSLTAYLFQSVAWLVLFAPFTLHLGSGARSPLALGAAAGGVVWMASLAAAGWSARLGRRGPAETALRRLVYQ
jgi:uncharacterized membrane protein YeiB